MSRKVFPTNYPEDVKRVINTLLFPKSRLEVAGSVSLRSQLYWGDIDCLQDINAPNVEYVAEHLKRIVRDVIKLPNTYVADCKCGSVEAYRIIPRDVRIMGGKVINYNAEVSKQVVDKIPYLSDKERVYYKKLLVTNPTVQQYFLMKDTFKDHILRWSAKDLLVGRVTRPDGKTMTLEEAIACPSMLKLDVVSWLQGNRFVEISMIYEIHIRGKIINERFPLEHNIKENVVEYAQKGDYFKVLKRIFSLANLEKRKTTIDLLIPILNSDLGKMYQIVSDAKTILELLERHIYNADMKYEIDQFKQRLSYIANSNDFLSNEKSILALIEKAEDRKTMVPALNELVEVLGNIMNGTTKKIMKSAKLLPLPTNVLP